MSQVLSKEAKSISIDILVDERPTDFIDLEMRVAQSSTLLVILTANALKQPEVVFAMLCAKYYFASPSQVILIHDAGSCLFPGYDEQPSCVGEFFSEKAITYLKGYALDGVLQIIEKRNSELESLRNFIKNNEQAAKALYKQIVEKTVSPSNQLPVAEFQKALMELDPTLVSSEIANLVKRADPNQDNIVEEQEFCEVLSRESRLKELLTKYQASQECSKESLTTTVFLSHKRSTGQGIAGRLYEGLKDDYSIFLDSEAKFKIHDLKQIVLNTRVFVFILTSGIFQSQWCLEELKSAVANNKQIIIIRELSFQLPEELPEAWQDSLGVLLKRRKPLVWMAEYNNSCIEALKVLIGVPDKSREKAEQFLADKTNEENLLKNHTLIANGVTGLPMVLAKKYPEAIIKYATFTDCGPTAIDMKYHLNFVEKLVIPHATFFDPRCVDTLTHLEIGATVPLNCMLIGACVNLKHLSILGEPSSILGDPSFFSAVAKCTHLEWFELVEDFRSARVSDDAIIPFFRSCTKLKHLDLKQTWSLSAKSLVYLSHCTGLEMLCYAPLSSQTDITDESLVPIARECKSLNHLHIQCARITDATLLELTASCTQLEVLHLGGVLKIHDASIQALKKLPKLRKLTLTDGEYTDFNFSGMSSLEHVMLSSANFLLEVNLSDTPNLKYVAISDLQELTNINFNNSAVEELRLSEFPSLQQMVLAHLTNLRYLEIAEVPKLALLDISGASKLEKSELRKLGPIQTCHATGCNSVKKLLILNCSDSCDPIVEQVGLHCPNLDYMQLNCEVTDNAIAKLAHCTKLKTFSVDSALVGDQGLVAVFENCPELEEVLVGPGPRVTDLSLVSLIQHCKNVHYIYFSETAITDAGVNMLIQNVGSLEKLQSLSFPDNKQVTATAMSNLKEVLATEISLNYF